MADFLFLSAKTAVQLSSTAARKEAERNMQKLFNFEAGAEKIFRNVKGAKD